MFPLFLVPITVMSAKIFLPVLLVQLIMKFTMTVLALFLAQVLSSALLTNHAQIASPAAIHALMAPLVTPVLLAMI